MTTATIGAEAREPRVVRAASSASLRFTARSSATVIPAGVVLAYIAVPPPHYHLHAKHDDPTMLGSEVALVVAVMFVGWRLVGGRLLS
jgi:hypothetical protein